MTITLSDSELVSLSVNGDRDAFAQIVARYQSLICCITYSATGSISQSEDLAQETFLTAWKQLRQLAQPDKLRPWLCGITRNLSNNFLRRGNRRTASLDSAGDIPSTQASPPEQAITREEQAILSESLRQLPQTHREPLILFYREQQSVERVAVELDLSEDTVRQRLSRGRKLLQEQVTALIERGLRQTAPGHAFTLAVVAALPAMKLSVTAAGLGATAVKGTAAAKAAAGMGLAGAVLGPVIGLLGGWFGTRTSIEATRSPRERRFVVRQSKFVWVYALAFCAHLWAFTYLATHHWRTHPIVISMALIGLVVGYTTGLVVWVFWANRKQRLIRAQESPQTRPGSRELFEYRSRLCMIGLPLLHIKTGYQPNGKVAVAKGWIAVGDVSFGALLSIGGVSVGAVSLGGVSVGLISIGGAAIGAMSVAGLAVGVWSLGGLAVGYLAIGGCAIAWKGAFGGLAIARHFALGGAAVAQHANDVAARVFMKHHWFLRWCRHAL